MTSTMKMGISAQSHGLSLQHSGIESASSHKDLPLKWDQHEQRCLKTGKRFRWCPGSATSNPTTRYGVAIRIGHDRYSKEYRVQLDNCDELGDQWRGKHLCWPHFPADHAHQYLVVSMSALDHVPNIIIWSKQNKQKTHKH